MAKGNPHASETVAPPGEQREGFVLAKILLVRGSPDSVVPGVGRYPRMKRDEVRYIHPDDIAAHPEYYELYTPAPEAPKAPLRATAPKKPDPKPEEPVQSGNAI